MFKVAQKCSYSMEWNFTSRSVSTVANNYDSFLRVFDKIVKDKSMDDDTLDVAKGFLTKLEDFEFVFMLYTYTVNKSFLMWYLILSSRGL